MRQQSAGHTLTCVRACVCVCARAEIFVRGNFRQTPNPWFLVDHQLCAKYLLSLTKSANVLGGRSVSVDLHIQPGLRLKSLTHESLRYGSVKPSAADRVSLSTSLAASAIDS